MSVCSNRIVKVLVWSLFTYIDLASPTLLQQPQASCYPSKPNRCKVRQTITIHDDDFELAGENLGSFCRIWELARMRQLNAMSPLSLTREDVEAVQRLRQLYPPHLLASLFDDGNTSLLSREF